MECNGAGNGVRAKINYIYGFLPKTRIAFSATSFPKDFGNIPPDMPIKERQLYELAVVTANKQNPQWDIIYSDRASARVQVLQKGGAVPYARIDYADSNKWYFFRADNPDEKYRSVAMRTIQSAEWNSRLNIWGTQMIERTAQGDEFGITSPVKATAVRINLHLHHQVFYNDRDNLLNTDDEWVD